jgi:hypothetical protein
MRALGLTRLKKICGQSEDALRREGRFGIGGNLSALAILSGVLGKEKRHGKHSR